MTLRNGSIIVPGTFRGQQDQYVLYWQDGQRFEQVEYAFDFEWSASDGAYRIYIVDQPDYMGRPTGGHDTHRYWDASRGQYYICVRDDLRPTTLAHAKNWAKRWAEATERFRRSGQTFY
jgi:hypothetical protein